MMEEKVILRRICVDFHDNIKNINVKYCVQLYPKILIHIRNLNDKHKTDNLLITPANENIIFGILNNSFKIIQYSIYMGAEIHCYVVREICKIQHQNIVNVMIENESIQNKLCWNQLQRFKMS